jgi:hypothetical protein
VRYSRADQIVPRDRWTSEVTDDRPVDTLFYTTSVVNTPSSRAFPLDDNNAPFDSEEFEAG